MITVAPRFHFFALFSHKISWTILGSVFHCFCIICWKVFLQMYLPFSRPIFRRFSYRISYLFTFLLFRRTLGDTYSTWEFGWFSYMHLLKNFDFSWEAILKTIEMQVCFRINLLPFSWFLRHRFPHRFFHRFLIENCSKMGSEVFWESIRFATFKCLDKTNQWTDRTFIFSYFS